MGRMACTDRTDRTDRAAGRGSGQRDAGSGTREWAVSPGGGQYERAPERAARATATTARSSA